MHRLFPGFNRFDSVKLATMSTYFSYVEAEPGKVVARQGEEVNGVYYVVAGELKAAAEVCP